LTKYLEIYLSSKYFQKRYYQSVEELPVWNWWKIHETRDLKYLLKQNKKLTLHADAIFDKIYSEFISIFGVGENYKQYLEKLKEIAIAEIDMVLYKDPSMETFIDIMKVELEEIKNANSGGTYMDTAIAVEKSMGFKLNTKEISVKEYYSYIKSLEKNGSR
jgi:hypothetical protein